MLNRIYRFALVCITVSALLLSGCGTSEKTQVPADTTVTETTVSETTVPETTVPETAVPETTVPETIVPETTVPETTIPETTVPETTADETAADQTAASPDEPGLLTDKLPNGDIVYAVDTMEYLKAHPEASALKAAPVNVDFFGQGEDGTLACFILAEPIKNCTYITIPMYFTFYGTKDPNTIEWDSCFLCGDLETCFLSYNGSYLEPNPAQLFTGVETFRLINNAVGLVNFAASEPYDICAVTAVPAVAPDGWDPYDISIENEIMVVGFPTEEDRQVFLDSLSK